MWQHMHSNIPSSCANWAGLNENRRMGRLDKKQKIPKNASNANIGNTLLKWRDA
jgi:hypothetical protein